MSHHLSNVALESAANRAVVVEQAPADGARSVAAAAPTSAAEPSAAAPATSTDTSAGTSAAPSSAAGSSGLAGANVPVENVQSASTQIRTAQADLATTSAAPRRLDGLDGVGGGGGGGDAAGAGDVQETGAGQVAAGTAEQDVSQGGLGGETTDTQVSGDAITIGAATDGGGADPTAGSAGQGG